MVQKPDCSWRQCGDYRCLNMVTEPDAYPLPYMMDLLPGSLMLPTLLGPGPVAAGLTSLKEPSRSLAATTGASPSSENDLQHTPLDFATMASHQLTCVNTKRTAISSTLEDRSKPVQGVILLCDFSSGKIWPLLLVEGKQPEFAATHNLAHPVIRATCWLLTARFV
jgi:hypothetical protein